MTSVLPPLKEEGNAPAMASVVEKKKNIFPLSSWGGVQTMITSYSMDYGKKDGTPSEKRPCSATRRNRPHPSKFFMNWRVPSKPILNNKTSFEPYAAEYSNTLQNFSEEYRGRDDPRAKRKITPPTVYKHLNEDETLKLIERLRISGKPDETFQLPLAQLNPEAISLVADLLKKATPQEQEEIERVFGLGAREKDCQDLPSYSFITPEAIRVLEQVLQRAGITDNDSAIRFLLSIGQVLMSISNSNIPAYRPRPPSEERVRKHTLRSAPIHSPNLLMQKHRDGICALCNKASLNNELQNISEKKVFDTNKSSRSYLENVPRLPKIRAPKRSMLPRPSKPNYPKVENKFATFVLPHRPIARSFTIHPEWD
ncbi:uncharacterized protein LOC114519011 [Dendronephthya gigantea]|uniref:uncharacterized protein LOC114519011 n=1 Tax=Dendronephthya gigantea TaxID=151771 RepID=UPI0010695920|nr:uncharacterized protein LOC114519011 [Dendronephthya gigantea]